jgi:hypothetical protein
VAELNAREPNYLGETPGGAITHSILIDPRDAQHIYVSLCPAASSRRKTAATRGDP